MEANIGRVPAHWRMGSFRLNPGPCLERLMNGHNPYLGLGHAVTSVELQEKVHDTLLEIESVRKKEAVVFDATVANDLVE